MKSFEREQEFKFYKVLTKKDEMQKRKRELKIDPIKKPPNY